MERCKILVKNFERTLSNATTKINLCFIRLMIKRLKVQGATNPLQRLVYKAYGSQASLIK
jgi:hypothetical protein